MEREKKNPEDAVDERCRRALAAGTRSAGRR